MNDDKTTIEIMKNNINSLKTGTLRFWGEWFGRPMDNCHKISKVQFNPHDYILTITFNEGETLTIWNPEGIFSDSHEFYIRCAIKIRWEWFGYGQNKIYQNLYYKQYENQNGFIVISSGRGALDYMSKKTIEGSGQHAVEIC